MIMRKISFILIICLLIALLTGCHGKKSSGVFEIPETFNENKQIELTFWAKNDTNVTQSRIYEKAATDFNKLYPNVKVNIRLYTDYGKIYNDVITNISTNTTPNVCITYPDHIATYLTGNDTVVKLDDLMKDPKYGLGGTELRFDGPAESEIVPSFLNECRIGENYYALPFMRSTEALYINKTYVVTIKGIIQNEEIEQLQKGVKIDNYITRPAKIKVLKTDEDKNISRIEITIHEGKNRQIRKMCEVINRKVLALHRSKIESDSTI